MTPKGRYCRPSAGVTVSGLWELVGGFLA